MMSIIANKIIMIIVHPSFNPIINIRTAPHIYSYTVYQYLPDELSLLVELSVCLKYFNNAIVVVTIQPRFTSRDIDVGLHAI